MVAKSIRLIFISSFALLSACSTLLVNEEPTKSTRVNQPEDIEIASNFNMETELTVVEQLQLQANSLSATGEYAKAEQVLERALRIESDNAQLYAQIAQARLDQGKFSDAEQIAMKGLTYAQSDAAMTEELRQLIDMSRTGN